MGYAEGQRWWERWQLHALVLGSLFLQFFLLLAAVLRKRRTPPWFRFVTWASYLGSDALAIYALATLFSRYKRTEGATQSLGGSSGLEVLLAPILVLHLGGRDGITAYSIQDNELWRRRFLIAGSQVAVAIYVFRKTWPPGGDKRLLLAAILMFVPGVAKCLDKPWALKKSAFNTMAATVDGEEAWSQKNSSHKEGCCKENPRKERSPEENPHEEDGSQEISALEEGRSQPHQELSQEEGCCEKVHSLEEFVREASRVYAEPVPRLPIDKEKLPYDPYHLFVDLPWPYSARIDNLRHLRLRSADKVHLVVRSGLSKSFDLLYTNNKDYLSALPRAMLVAMTFAAVGFFTAVSRGGAYADADLRAMDVLLWSTAGLELISFLFIVASCLRRLPLIWPEQVPQCNLIGYLVHREKHRRLRKLAALLGCDVFADWIWCTAPSRALRSSRGITEMIYTHITNQWKKPEPERSGEPDRPRTPIADTAIAKDSINMSKNYIQDIAAYQKFSDSRGQWTLDKEGCGKLPKLPPNEDPPIYSLASSVSRPFDQTVIVWHLATELCFFDHVDNGSDENRRCREISNYMVYLLLVKPEMLMPGARRRVFTVAYEQVRRTLVKDDSPEYEDDDELEKKKLPRGAKDDIARKIMEKVDPTDATAPELVRHARILAKDLRDLATDKGEEKMWRVIQGVWVEMLCFSASRCRGYLHAKSLATGGEYLSYVWLLRAYMGLETLGDRIQRPEDWDLLGC